jgi:hypothetical protein
MRWFLPFLILTSCKTEELFTGLFDLPAGAAVLHPSDASPWDEPIGLIANGHFGEIVQLALKQGRYVTDDPTVSFLRTNPLPTGRSRLLSSVAPWAVNKGDVRVFAGDRRFEQLVELAWITGINADGSPEEGDVDVSDVTFDDVDGSGDSPTLTAIEAKRGYTSTESWTATYDGSAWTVEGSRSGFMEFQAFDGEAFVGDSRTIAFTISGAATAGDQFSFSTDNGLIEHDVGGIPLRLAMSADDQLAMLVHDTTLDMPFLRWFDPATKAVTEEPLASDAEPTRLSFDEAGTLWVSDMARSGFWEITDAGPVEHVMPWPTLDVAVFVREDGSRRAFVVPDGARDVWIYDVETQTFVDVNGLVEGTQPMNFRSPVRGIEAMPVPFEFPERDADGVRKFERAAAIALHRGEMQWIEEATGCLVKTGQGPSTVENSTFGTVVDFSTNFEGISGGPYLEQSPTTGAHVQVNPCAGIAPGEGWRVRFSEPHQGWSVQGTLSGEQATMAFEDERYVSDDGTVSFVIRAGQQPTSEGYEITFNVRNGVLTANGDNDGDGSRDVEFEEPADPVFFHYRVGPSDGAYRPVDDRPFLLTMSQAGNLVGRVKPQTGEVEVIWQ